MTTDIGMFALALLAAFCIGVSKAGFSGVSMVSVLLLASPLKVPLSAGLCLINPETLLENAKLAPAVLAGVIGGKVMLHRVPQRLFEWLVIGFAVIAGVRLCGW